ncbi:MAG TPA: tetratricopeptide repeat-containing glycosyltransferase family protein [Xanthobacteraceae bacterium]|nr:tetratricopeptide repeat-containing glycosyltransferase family protein [Xanthobacteraceae bacterium]
MPTPKVRKKSPPNSSAELRAAVEAERAGRLLEAEALYRSVIASDPKQWQALHQLGSIHLARGELAEALLCIGGAMKANAGSAEVTSNYGLVLCRLKRDHEAVEYFNRALILKPGYVPALLTRSASLQHLGRREEALGSIDRVIEIEPLHARAHYNRAHILLDMLRFDEALKAYERAAELAPDDADIHWNEALLLLMRGEYRRGWEKYEWRLKRPHHQERNFFAPVWRGEDVAGKTILIHAEQGFGDTLQFVRYVPLLAKMGARVFLEVQPALKPLMETLGGVSQLFARGEALPEFDLHCPIMSLPLAFKTELETIPANVPYLHAPAIYAEKWRERFPRGEKPAVAIACSGSLGNEENDIRSIPLECFAPLFADDSISWLVVQRELLPRDRAFLETQPQVRHFGEELADFADTAALISQTDLVISVCTSLAHLAGALNFPFWLLSKYIADFRWLLDRVDSPWYPSARIIRQPAHGDWTTVIEVVRNDLKSLIAR